MTPSEQWWDCAPAGMSIRNNIQEQIMEGKCVFLETSRLPWIEELSRSVQAEVAKNDAELNWNEIDAEEVAGISPTKYLGGFYGVDQIAAEKKIQQNIRQLQSCCWVKNIPEQETNAWIQMAKDLVSSKEKLKFRLVLELPTVSVRGIGKIVAVKGDIERFDVYYFAISVLATGRLCKNFREYAATLCTELADGDVERCYDLCRDIDNVLRNPLSTCGEDRDETYCRQLVCRAQTRSISPLIDIGRLKFISPYEDQLINILPQKDDFDNIIENVNEVELRHLVYFSGRGWLTIAPESKEILNCLYEDRNTISHLGILSYDKIRELFCMLKKLG